MIRSTGLGTRLRLLTAALDDAVERVYREAGLDFRPRFFPFFQLLVHRTSASVGECAAELGFTQPATSQTLQLMARSGWIEVVPGEDRREHRYALTPRARGRLPELQSIWDAIARAAATLDAALPAPLAATIDAALESLDRQSFHALIAKELAP